MRAKPNRLVKWLPNHGTLAAARIASEKLLRRVEAGRDPLGACSIVKKQRTQKNTKTDGLPQAAVKHQSYVKGATMYPLEHSVGHGMLCTVPNV
ncbi:hypothetical protein IFM89_032228 [Coptis chinensis]|uniref:Uncharacterized protein n=1 Tax=Coptis chinensis TaxID=261450 RepID=A0A835HZ68_9MAGN|nr:hypothetical protein IFM89_032228 [Coptis chinensis]